MEDVRVCRICLAMDVKMYDIFPLHTYLELVVGNNPLTTTDLPPYVCFECAMLLRKYHNFYERCILGQSVLYGILHTTGKITSEEIKQVNRDELRLTSQLTMHHIPEDNIIHLVYDKVKPKSKSKLVDKLVFQNLNEADVVKAEDVFDANFIETNLVKDEDSLTEGDYVKEEDDDTNDFSFADGDFVKKEHDHITGLSSDDEPLLLHKEKKAKKKKVGRGRKKKKVDNRFEEIIKVADIKTELSELLTLKRKRGRPRKTETGTESQSASEKMKPRRTRNTGGVEDDDVNLEDYVTIIKLSVDEQIEEINKRQGSSNYLNAAFQCNLCYKGFIDTHAWRHHVGKHDPSAGDVECPICKFRFKSKRALQKHAANHEKKFACKACPYVSKTTTQAKQHQRWHKGVTYQCQYCDEVSTKWTSYLSHVRMKHPSTHVCGACGYSFVSALGLAMHRTMMHKDVLEKLETSPSSVEGPHCAECGVNFISEEAYKRHMVTSLKHMQTNNYNTGCRVCGERFSSAEELRLHHRKEHAKKRPKNYGKKPSHMTWPARCEHCSEEIGNAREYWAHFRRVHPDKSYPIQKNHVCDICGKSFRGNAFLVYHKRTHFEERAYKCAVCPKAFFNRTNLQMHEKTHSDSRPYPCDICIKAFKCKGALDRHYRCHTGQKPYECEVCGKAFGQSNSRKLHVRTVHLKQPAPYVSRARLERRQANGATAAPTHWTQ